MYVDCTIVNIGNRQTILWYQEAVQSITCSISTKWRAMYINDYECFLLYCNWYHTSTKVYISSTVVDSNRTALGLSIDNDTNGVFIKEIKQDSYALSCGLFKVNDHIIKMNDTYIVNCQQVQSFLCSRKTISFSILYW